MAKTRKNLRNLCIRKTKDNSSDAQSGFDEDVVIAEGLVDILLNDNETRKTTKTLSLEQGTAVYNLDSSTASIEQMRIISPTNYEKSLDRANKEKQREINATKSNDSQSIPSFWYFVEPTVSAAGIETKRVEFDTIPDQSYTVEYSIIKKDGLMDADDDYPFFDGRLHHILANYAIWQYAEREADEAMNPIYWETQWEKGLALILEAHPKEAKHQLSIPGPDQYEED